MSHATVKGGTTDDELHACQKSVLTLTEDELHGLLRSVNCAKHCVLLHPTRESEMYFNLIANNSKWMFSGGNSFFADVVKSFSISVMLEKTIVRDFFDRYTSTDRSKDWTRFYNHSKEIAPSYTDDQHYDLYITDVKGIIREACRCILSDVVVENSISLAQRTLTNALHWHATFNVVPCIKNTNHTRNRFQVWKPEVNNYQYEKVITDVCKKIGEGSTLKMTVPTREDTVFVYNHTTKQVQAFLYCTSGKERLLPIDVFFFDDIDHSSFVRLPRRPFIQTQSLCETMIPIEMYIHNVEGKFRQHQQSLGSKMTVVVQNEKSVDDDLSSHGQKRKLVSLDNKDLDARAKKIAESYKEEMTSIWSQLDKNIHQVKKTGMLPNMTGRLAHGCVEDEMSTAQSHRYWTRSQKDPAIDITEAVRALQTQDPISLGGEGARRTFQHIETANAKQKRELLQQQETVSHLNHALLLSAAEKTKLKECNKQLYAEVSEKTLLNNNLQMRCDTLKRELYCNEQELYALRDKLHVTSSERDSLKEKDIQTTLGGSEILLPTDQESVNFVNVSDNYTKPVRFMNAYFSSKRADEHIREEAKQMWNHNLQRRLYLKEGHTHTGHILPRRNTILTARNFPERFCKHFTGWEIKGTVVLDKVLESTDSVNMFFDEEMKSTWPSRG